MIRLAIAVALLSMVAWSAALGQGPAFMGSGPIVISAPGWIGASDPRTGEIRQVEMVATAKNISSGDVILNSLYVAMAGGVVLETRLVTAKGESIAAKDAAAVPAGTSFQVRARLPSPSTFEEIKAGWVNPVVSVEHSGGKYEIAIGEEVKKSIEAVSAFMKLGVGVGNPKGLTQKTN